MTMRKTLIAAAAVALLTGLDVTAVAQGPGGPPPDKIFTSSAEVQAQIAGVRKIHKDEPTISRPILSLAPYRASLEYRTATGPAAVHEKEAEMFYVIEGTGTLTTGGKLKDEKRQNTTNLGGTGIEGGVSRMVSRGDFIIVPEGTPHQYTDIKGELILMSLHVPRG
jgi:mannose-6-phosphate isomerase-like protein (cupin superfamily)